jgi:hypothetical protein
VEVTIPAVSVTTMSDALSDADLRSLDVQCAEVMGYETKWCHVWISGDFMWAYPEPTNRTTYEPMYEVWRGHGSIFNEEKWELVPHYASDLAASRLLEDEIEERDLWEDYTLALSRIIEETESTYRSSVHKAWRLLRTTPHQRARAFLMAMHASVEEANDSCH